MRGTENGSEDLAVHEYGLKEHQHFCVPLDERISKGYLRHRI